MALLPIKNIVKIDSKIKFFLFIFFSIFIFQESALSVDYKPEYKFSKDCYKENKQYYVKKVFDGDTIGIIPIKSGKKTRYEKIRFLGIDAFEHDQKPYGDPAYKYLSMLVLGKNVCIETDVDEHDKYGRTLGYVFLKDGVIEKNLRYRTARDFMSTKSLTTIQPHHLLVNEEIIKNGYAILYASEPNIKYKERLKKAVVHARTNMLGAWEKKDYILETPSEFRKKHPHKKKFKKSKRKKANFVDKHQ